MKNPDALRSPRNVNAENLLTWSHVIIDKESLQLRLHARLQAVKLVWRRSRETVKYCKNGIVTSDNRTRATTDRFCYTLLSDNMKFEWLPRGRTPANPSTSPRMCHVITFNRLVIVRVCNYVFRVCIVLLYQAFMLFNSFRLLLS